MLMDRERSEVGNGTRKVWTGVGESAKINELLKSNRGDENSNGISDELGVGVRMGEDGEGRVEGAKLGDGDTSCEDMGVVVGGRDDMVVGKRKIGVDTDIASNIIKLEDTIVSEKTGVISTCVVGSSTGVRGAIVMGTMVVSRNKTSVVRLGDGDMSCEESMVVGGRDEMLVGKRKMGVDIVLDVTTLEDTKKTGVSSTTAVVRGPVVMGTIVVSRNKTSVVRLGDGVMSCEDMGVVVGGRDNMLVGKRKIGVDIVSDITTLEDTNVGKKTGVRSSTAVVKGPVIMGTIVVSVVRLEGMGTVVGGSDDMLVGKRKIGVDTDIVSDVAKLEGTSISEKTGVSSTCVVGSTAGSVVMGTMVVSGDTSVVSSERMGDTGVGVKMVRDCVISDSGMGIRKPSETLGLTGMGVELGSKMKTLEELDSMAKALELGCRKKALLVGSRTKGLEIGSRVRALEILGCRRSELENGSGRKELAKSVKLGSKIKALELMGDGVMVGGMEEKGELGSISMLERTVKGKEGVGVMTTSTMDVEIILRGVERLATDSTGIDGCGSNV